ncbi:transposase [Prauserella flavalba]|uniref:transposase n=1 Tax=Prauserella flavalba TaxID=1477506 RepID=UPI0036EDBF50
MPKAYPPEFRGRAVAVVRAGKPVREAARELGISESCLHTWVKQDRIDRGERAGLSSTEHAELAAAMRRIRQLETELEVLREASEIYELKGDPQGRSPIVARLAERGLPVKLACRLLEVSRSWFYGWRSRPASLAALRREWLTGVITEIHARSRGTYGAPRVRAELRLGMGIMAASSWRGASWPSTTPRRTSSGFCRRGDSLWTVSPALADCPRGRYRPDHRRRHRAEK